MAKARYSEVRHNPKSRNRAGRGERTFTIKVTAGRNTQGRGARNYWAKACAVRGIPTERQAQAKCFYGTSYKSPTQAVGIALRGLIKHHRDPNWFRKKYPPESLV